MGGFIFIALFGTDTVPVVVKNGCQRRRIPYWHIWARIYRLHVQRFPVYSMEIVKP